MKLLNTGNTGFRPDSKTLSEQRKEIISKWNESGFLDGLGALAELGGLDYISYHKNKYNYAMKIKAYNGAEFHLSRLISVMEDKIIDKHCE